LGASLERAPAAEDRSEIEIEDEIEIDRGCEGISFGES